MQTNMKKSGLQNVEDELSRYTNKNGEKGVISSVKNTSSSVPLTNSITKKTEAVNPSAPVVASGTSSKPLATSGVNPTYQGNDFLQWHKTLFGTDYDSDANTGWSRPEWMTDVDYEIGTNLYQAYLSNKLLEDMYVSQTDELQDQYDDSIAALDTSKNTSLQQADVMRQRVEKYLPAQLKAQGLGGLGIGQQMQLDAYNDYISNIGKINSEYNANRTDLSSSHNAALAELERGYITSKAEQDLAAADNVMEAIKEHRDEFANDSNVLLTDLLKYLDTEGENYLNPDGSISESNYNKLLEYLTDYEDRLTDADKARLEAALKLYARDITEGGEIDTQSYIDKIVSGAGTSVQKEINNLSEADLDQVITDVKENIMPDMIAKLKGKYGDIANYFAVMMSAPLLFEDKVISEEMSKSEYVSALLSAVSQFAPMVGE